MNGRLRTACLVVAALARGASTPCLAAEASPYGVNVHAPAGEELAALLDAAAAARLGWVRIDFHWSWVEPQRGTRDYRVYDDLVREARSRGLEVYATLQGTPAWATDGPPGTGVPRDAAEWRAFVSDAARRYRGRVKAWGVWNEPNLARFWSGTRTQYLERLLRPAAEEVRRSDPDALVCGPELAHLRGDGADWPGWLLEVLQRAGDAIDVVTHHVYDEAGFEGVRRKLEAPTAFGGSPEYWSVVAPSVREVLRAAGAEGKPFWLTETGWASDVAGEAEQARRIAGLLGDWYGRPGGPPWVAKAFLYELVDDGSEGVGRWGLLRPDRSPKAAYAAVSGFISTFPPWGDAAELVAAEIPAASAPGVPVTARVTLRNLGRSNWTREAGHALAPLADASLLSPGRVALPSGRPVATGETATFAFELTPPHAGSFLAEWRLVTEDGPAFGPVFSRKVTAAGPCAEPPAPTVNAAPTGSLPAGSLAAFAWADGAAAGTRPASRVQLLRSRPFAEAELLVDAEVEGASFAWRPPAEAGATIGFRVAARSSCGALGPFSPTVFFSVATPRAAIVPTRGQGAPWLVRAGTAAPTALLAFRNAGGEGATVRFDATESAFAVAPLSAALAPGEEATLVLSARPGATSAPGVRSGHVVATWTGGSVSTPVAMAVASGEVGSARVEASPAELRFVAPAGAETATAEVAVTNPGSAPVLLVPRVEPGGAWLSVATADLTDPLRAGETRRVRVAVDRRRRTAEDGASPVRTVLTLAAAGGDAGDRVDLPVVDAEPAAPVPAARRGSVPAGLSSWVVPTAVRQAGALGQAFSSSLVVGNLGDAPATVDVYASVAGTDGEREALRATVSAPAAGTLVLDEVLPLLFGPGAGAAHLELRSAAPLAVRSVVTGTSPAGDRFSAEVPVVAAGEGTGPRRPPLLLPGLKVTGSTRCNVVLAETTGRGARVALRLLDAEGRPLGRGEVSVPAWGNAQVGLAAAVGLPGAVPEASSLRVEPLEGEGRVVALATLVDNVSASFSVVTGRPAPQDGDDGAGPQALASVVQSPGIRAFFTTEVSIATAAPRAAPLRLAYTFAGTDAAGQPVRGTAERELLLPPAGALPIALGENAVRALFGWGPATSTSGTLRIEGDGAGRVLARAAVSTPLDLSDPSRGRMTAELPAVGPRSAEAVGEAAPSGVVLPGLRAWERERANLVAAEVAGAPARVLVSLLADGNVLLGEREVALGPFEKVQWNDLWNGPSGFALGRRRADRLTLAASPAGGGPGRVVLAVTTVDNVTNGTRIQLLAPPGPATLGGPSGR